MVLLSPWLNVALNNPNIGFVHDPLLPVGPAVPDRQGWAGGLPENDYLVSPLYGSLKTPRPTYVYSGSLDSLGPDMVVLDQDGFGYLPQIEQELGI